MCFGTTGLALSISIVLKVKWFISRAHIRLICFFSFIREIMRLDSLPTKGSDCCGCTTLLCFGPRTEQLDKKPVYHIEWPQYVLIIQLFHISDWSAASSHLCGRFSAQTMKLPVLLNLPEVHPRFSPHQSFIFWPLAQIPFSPNSAKLKAWNLFQCHSCVHVCSHL